MHSTMGSMAICQILVVWAKRMAPWTIPTDPSGSVDRLVNFPFSLCHSSLLALLSVQICRILWLRYPCFGGMQETSRKDSV